MKTVPRTSTVVYIEYPNMDTVSCGSLISSIQNKNSLVQTARIKKIDLNTTKTNKTYFFSTTYLKK